MNSTKEITHHSKVRKVNLSKFIYNKMLEFLGRKINIKDFEQWIYSCDQISSELDCDEYLKLIEFDFNGKDAYYSLDKILNDLLGKYTEEHTEEVVVSGLKTSEIAYDMLLEGKIVDAINRRDEIKKVFQVEGIPVFDKVIDFQEQFGGVWYKIGKRFYNGFRMNLFYYSDFKNKYVFNYFIKKEGKYFFQCMDYHYAGDIGPCIDQDGKIYHFAMGQLFLCANSIEEFIEDEAIKFYLVCKYEKWLSRGCTIEEINEFKKTNAFYKIEKESFSGKYFEWWCDTDETIFVRIDLTRKYSYAVIYCKDKNILMKLYNIDKPVSLFPHE